MFAPSSSPVFFFHGQRLQIGHHVTAYHTPPLTAVPLHQCIHSELARSLPSTLITPDFGPLQQNNFAQQRRFSTDHCRQSGEISARRTCRLTSVCTTCSPKLVGRVLHLDDHFLLGLTWRFFTSRSCFHRRTHRDQTKMQPIGVGHNHQKDRCGLARGVDTDAISAAARPARSSRPPPMMAATAGALPIPAMHKVMLTQRNHSIKKFAKAHLEAVGSHFMIMPTEYAEHINQTRIPTAKRNRSAMTQAALASSKGAVPHGAHCVNLFVTAATSYQSGRSIRKRPRRLDQSLLRRDQGRKLAQHE
jgi:hypothetical protein